MRFHRIGKAVGDDLYGIVSVPWASVREARWFTLKWNVQHHILRKGRK